MSKPKYLTFPIVLLRNSLTNVGECIDNAFDYCLYDCSQRNDLTSEEAAEDLGIDFRKLIESFKNGKILFESLPDNSAKTSIRKDMLFDFYKNNKTDFEKLSFLAFAAIRSILQRQQYVRLTNKYLLSRMSGNNINDDISPFLKPYTKRYQLDKIKNELQLNWGLKMWAIRLRGFYVSFNLSILDLAKIAESRKAEKANRIADLKAQKSNAREAALAEIKEQLKEQQNSTYK